jgi:hypothetical protein
VIKKDINNKKQKKTLKEKKEISHFERMRECARCFLDITIDGKTVGRIVVALAAATPRTSNNFRLLCTGEAGFGKVSHRPLCFKGLFLGQE